MISTAEYKLPFEASFTGREQELELLARVTEKPGSVTVLTGQAGVGKTALLGVFELKYGKEYEGGIFHLGSHLGIKNLLENLSSLYKTKTRALVVIDDAEMLSSNQLGEIRNYLGNYCSLVISGRIVSLDRLPNANVISLSNLDVSEMIKARANYLGLRKIIDIVDENPLLFEFFQKTPKDILEEFNENLGLKKYHLQVIQPDLDSKFKVNIRNEKDVILGLDYISLLFSFLLFIISYTSSLESEQNIIEEIRILKKTVIQEIKVEEIKNVVNPHFTTDFVNLRNTPEIMNDNLIKILVPNQVVNLLEIERQWAKVEFHDHILSVIAVGWIHTNYLAKVEL